MQSDMLDGVRRHGGGVQGAHIRSRIPGQKELTQSYRSAQVIKKKKKKPALRGKKPGTSSNTTPTVWAVLFSKGRVHAALTLGLLCG